jgi:hypothetical protein
MKGSENPTKVNRYMMVLLNPKGEFIKFLGVRKFMGWLYDTFLVPLHVH